MDAIAVVGLGCVLPNALRVSDFWTRVCAGHLSLAPVPPRAWDHSLYFHPDRTVPDRAYAQLGGFVTDFVFDWRKYKVPPADTQKVNPMQWMLLDAGVQALSEVRVLPQDTTGIILGATSLGNQRDSGMHIRLEDMLDAVRTTDAFRALPLHRQQEVLDTTAQRLRARLKECSDDNVLGSSASVAVGRINMQFDLKGAHYTVDAGYSSSLAALDLAVRGLRDGEFDLAVAGGVSEMLSPLEFIAFSKLGGMSSKGHVRPFSDEADGTLLGEGVALFALKRLEDAQRDGETIYAVLRGVGGSSDGRGKSLVSPRREGQALAMRRALDDAGVDPTGVQYVECHATGTQVGDASEVQALASVYAAAEGNSIALGSVKANIGHLRAGAGAAGLLKAVLALHHGQIPPQPGVERVNPRLELERTPFFVPRKAQSFRPGPAPLAAVSSFSFGGNNYHAVLEAWRPSPSRPSAPRRRPSEPLAIIGMGGMFPDAPDVESLWKRLLEGHDATREVPAERWKTERYVHPDRPERSYTKLGCWLEKVPPPTLEMRIPPAAWASLDPSHVVTLISAEQALKDAGYAPDKWDRDRVAISLGFLPNQGIKFLTDARVRWAEFAQELRETLEKSGLPESAWGPLLRSAEERYKEGLPPISEDTLTGYLGCLNAGRIAALYDFHGPHMMTDAACASSLSALHAAWKLLQHREADVVLTGGVWCDMSPEFYVAGCRFNALSARGSSPFSQNADGFVPGEGAGILVLKRLSDAERDGDRIHAVIRSVAGSSDGKGRSVLPPSEMGETLAMRRALAAANVAPPSVDYVECHGTGTALGDVVETKSIHNAYGEGRPQPLLIGSVKSNIGHLNAAAGVAGMIKVTRALREHRLPHSLKSEPRNPKVPQGIEVVTTPREWPAPADGGPRRAGVNSFGVGGANFHTLLEEYRAPAPKPLKEESKEEKEQGEPAEVEPRLLAVAGADARACLERLDRMCEQTGALEDTRQTPEGPYRVALTARTREELRKKRDFLRKALEMGGDLEFLNQSGIFAAGPDSPLRGAPVAITFPGQGGQYANMLRPLARAYPVVAATLEEADRVYLPLTGHTLTSCFFTEDAKGYKQNDEDIHAAVLLVNVALYRLLRAHGIRAEVLVGQSAGELAALVASGGLSLAEALRAILGRTRAVLGLPPGRSGQMLALTCSSDQVPELLAGLPGYATLAADNGPRACIVSADREAMLRIQERCAEKAIDCTVLAVSHGYHSALIAEARPIYENVLRGVTFRAPSACIVSTIDGEDYDGRPLEDYPTFLGSQLVEPVRLRQALGEAHRRGARIFIEAGPKWSLTQFTRETLKGRTHGAVASIHPKVGDMEQFKRMVGYTFVNGVGQLSADSAGGEAGVEQVLLGMPLEGLLEPATALKIALALGREFGVDASGARPENLRTFDAIIALVEQLRTGLAASGEAPRQAAPAASAPPAPPPPPSQPVTTVQKSITLEAEVRRVLMDTVVAKTGYPEDMLELDLDLEADLGIDTVKQVDIFARTREAFAVQRDPNRALREFNTLRKVIEHIVERVLATQGGAPAPAPAPVAARPPPPPPAPPAPAPVPMTPVYPTATMASGSFPAVPAGLALSLNLFEQVRDLMLLNVVAKTGYPEDMLELDLDLEADLGIDTVKQVDIFARTREAFGATCDPARSLREFNTLRKAIDHIVERARMAKGNPAPSSAAPSPAKASAPPPASLPQEAPRRVEAGGQRTVRDALLALDLRQVGARSEELSRLGHAVASRLGAPSPDTGQVRTLGELVQHLRKDR